MRVVIMYSVYVLLFCVCMFSLTFDILVESMAMGTKFKYGNFMPRRQFGCSPIPESEF